MVLVIHGEKWYTMIEGAKEIGVSPTTFRTNRRKYERETGIKVEKRDGNTFYITETDLLQIMRKYHPLRAMEKERG